MPHRRMLLSTTGLDNQQLDLVQGHHVNLLFQLLYRLMGSKPSKVRVNIHGNPLVPRGWQWGALAPPTLLGPFIPLDGVVIPFSALSHLFHLLADLYPLTNTHLMKITAFT